ncbi:MAG: hypothetical protein Ct9H300mP1_16160 [Planctomycetaceae bacterium]|nr:MAG: hypothetical protein Ct9H300mP1_16160 [Planctomycetaceae bacterium]
MSICSSTISIWKIALLRSLSDLGPIARKAVAIFSRLRSAGVLAGSRSPATCSRTKRLYGTSRLNVSMT